MKIVSLTVLVKGVVEMRDPLLANEIIEMVAKLVADDCDSGRLDGKRGEEYIHRSFK